MKNFILAVLVAAVLSSCGGGSSPPADLPKPTTLRTDLYYGYYGSYSSRMLLGENQGDQLTEVKDHTNLFMASRWGGPAEQITQLQEATAAGMAIVLDFPEPYEIQYGTTAPRDLVAAEIRVRTRLKQLNDLGLLKNVVSLYPQDEPEQFNIGNDWINETNAMIRRVAAEFSFTPKLSVFYTYKQQWPGISTYDWVGFDNYDQGDKIFTDGSYNAMKAKLRPDQSIMLIPGGCDKWRNQPEQFYYMAQNDKQVKVLMPFLWRDNADPGAGAGRGIRSNGLDFVYRQTGLKIKNGQ